MVLGQMPEQDALPASTSAFVTPSTQEQAAASPVTESFGSWLKQEMAAKKLSIAGLAEKTGISYPGIWNIVQGNTASPRNETRKKIAAALEEEIPDQIENELNEKAAIIPGFQWVDFTPSDLETIPELGGVYVFYDVTDRPVYVGKSAKNVRLRVKDHQTRFWFKEPLVVRGAFVAIADSDLCSKIELILIQFLGKHALLNVKGKVHDFEE